MLQILCDFQKASIGQPAALWGFVYLKWILCCDRKIILFTFRICNTLPSSKTDIAMEGGTPVKALRNLDLRIKTQHELDC